MNKIFIIVLLCLATMAQAQAEKGKWTFIPMAGANLIVSEPLDYEIGVTAGVTCTRCLSPCACKGNNYATIRNDIYDFDMHPWDSFKEIIRNVETIGADFIHGKGTPFTIRFKGVNKINHNYNKINNLIL